MIANLKKLEATDGSPDCLVAPNAERSSAPMSKPAGPSPELQMHAVPRDGWLSGPGRRIGHA